VRFASVSDPALTLKMRLLRSPLRVVASACRPSTVRSCVIGISPAVRMMPASNVTGAKRIVSPAAEPAIRARSEPGKPSLSVVTV
jgi:hypothetical protein